MIVGQIYGEGNTNTTERFPLQVFRNTFNKNGIYWSFGGGVSGVASRITNNITSNFDGYGIKFDGGTSREDSIAYNLIESNGHSIYLVDSYSDPSNMEFIYNTFTGEPSSEMIHVFGSGHSFNYNNFKNVSNYVIKNTSSSAINAENNYWGTTTSSEIAANIYDYTDNFELGAVDYDPYGSALVNTAPISPPQNVIMSTSGNGVKLTWTANSESDVAGYKIHYGGFTGYSYTNNVNAGNVTTYTINSGVTIDSSISVTAYDSNADGTDDMVEGYQSWFSVAKSKTKTVKTDGSGQFTTIQSAIDAASAGDTVLVYPGTYTENINYNGKDIVVVSKDGPNSTTIKPSSSSQPIVYFNNSKQMTLCLMDLL